MVAPQNDDLDSFGRARHKMLFPVTSMLKPKQSSAFVPMQSQELASRPSLTDRKSCAFTATMSVDKLIATAPTLMGSSSPQRTNSPAATGIATKLYAVAQTRFW